MTEQTPKLDAKTLEYVVACLQDDCKRYEEKMDKLYEADRECDREFREIAQRVFELGIQMTRFSLLFDREV